MTTDDLTRRAIIAAHDAECGDRHCEAVHMPSLNKREKAIVEAWRADRETYRCTCPSEPDQAVTGQCPVHGDMSAQAQGRRDYNHMATLRQEAADRAEKAEAAIERVREAVTVFCHGEQAYAEHEHYCMPLRAALDETEPT